MSAINMANDLPHVTDSTEEGGSLEPAEILEAFRESLFQATEASIMAQVIALWSSSFGRMPSQAEMMAIVAISARATINNLEVPIDQLRQNGTSSRLIKIAEESEARFEALKEAGKLPFDGPSLHSPLSQEQADTDAEAPRPSEKPRKAARVSRKKYPAKSA